MKDKNLLKTIVICVSVVICVCVASYVYYESNRYYINNGYIVDKHSGKVCDYDGKVDGFFKDKP